MSKYVAYNPFLSVQLLTVPVFTKLASQLSAEKLPELAVIPIIFVLQTAVSYLCSVAISRVFRFKKRAQNFVTAMGVFGNSNSLPISLVLSLSKTLPGLHWDKIPGDNDDEVAARGILYLLIFQQLGQLVRWSWGYHVLLAPAEKYSEEDGGTSNGSLESGTYNDEAAIDQAERRRLLDIVPGEEDYDQGDATPNGNTPHSKWTGSGTLTPMNQQHYASSSSTLDELNNHISHQKATPKLNGPIVVPEERIDSDVDSESEDSAPTSPATGTGRVKSSLSVKTKAIKHRISKVCQTAFSTLPSIMQTGLTKTFSLLVRFFVGLWHFMNPPLWAMLVAIIVASVPGLQHLFFSKGTFISNSVTRAIQQSGGVAVPLILVVLGANLARNTLPKEHQSIEDPKLEKQLLIASLISRMLLPTIIMAPLLALITKYVPVSILDDPIFVVVVFLLNGAPSALQLAQICQLNNVYLGAMTNLLFQSYVVWYVFDLSRAPHRVATDMMYPGFFPPLSFSSCSLSKLSNGHLNCHHTTIVHKFYTLFILLPLVHIL
jgi:predicted permease